jgi:uncharacterized protein YbjT (DUF2867 family)
MIVITAPTGDIGHQLVKNLLQSSAKIRVIARDPSHLSADVHDSAEVVEGSHGDPAIVNKAFAGADAVFWLTPPDPKAASVMAAYVDFTRPAAAALKAQGVKRVVGRLARRHRRRAPWPRESFLHGQHRPAGDSDQGSGQVLPADLGRRQASERRDA